MKGGSMNEMKHTLAFSPTRHQELLIAKSNANVKPRFSATLFIAFIHWKEYLNLVSLFSSSLEYQYG